VEFPIDGQHPELSV